MKNQAFTLIELLVVVLIIGILAAVALPQYTRAVEKSRLTEALSNIKAIENSIDIYLMENGYPSSNVYFEDMGAAAELTSAEWDEDVNLYITKYFSYGPVCNNAYCGSEINKIPSNDYAFWVVKGEYNGQNYDTWHHMCITQLSDMGRYICKYLQGFGWEYEDTEM